MGVTELFRLSMVVDDAVVVVVVVELLVVVMMGGKTFVMMGTCLAMSG